MNCQYARIDLGLTEMFPFNLENIRRCRLTEDYCDDDTNAAYASCPVYKDKIQQLLEEVRQEHRKKEEYNPTSGGWSFNR